MDGAAKNDRMSVVYTFTVDRYTLAEIVYIHYVGRDILGSGQSRLATLRVVWCSRDVGRTLQLCSLLDCTGRAKVGVMGCGRVSQFRMGIISAILELEILGTTTA